jgi:hypothetical protein
MRDMIEAIKVAKDGIEVTMPSKLGALAQSTRLDDLNGPTIVKTHPEGTGPAALNRHELRCVEGRPGHGNQRSSCSDSGDSRK